MGKSSYSTKVAMGALALMGYLGNVNSAEAQQPGRRNEIVSSNTCLSAAGDGIWLKNYCHDIDLRQDSRVDINQRYSLTALLGGNLKYEAFSTEKGVEIGVSRLRAQKPFTPRDVATVRFLQNIARQTPKNNPASVAALNEAVSDGVIYGSEAIGKIAPGRYAIMSASSNRSMPIFVDISYNAEKARQDSVSRAVANSADSTSNAERAKIREEYVADSTAEAVRDSIDKRNKSIADSAAKADSGQSAKKNTTSTKTGKEKYDWFTGKRKLGIEAGFGVNQEVVNGAFIELPLAYRVNLEVFGNYFVSSGNSDSLNVRADTTLRDKQLIGPGTYKQRTDEIVTTSEERARGETGLGLLLSADRLRLNLRGGVGISSQEETIDGRSTIAFERNMLPLGQPETITNSMKGNKKNLIQSAFSGGFVFDVNKNLALGVSVNKVGKRSGGRINLRYRF